MLFDAIQPECHFRQIRETGVRSTPETLYIFGWDEKVDAYRYWWFQSSGACEEATCAFLEDGTLSLTWHNSLLTQTFLKVNAEEVLLAMKRPATAGEMETILEVVLHRSRPATS